MNDNKIIVYGAPWCGFCHTAMRYLDDKGIKYTYVDVDQEPSGRQAVVEKSGQLGIPVLDIGGEIVVGFDRPRIDAALQAHQIA